MKGSSSNWNNHEIIAVLRYQGFHQNITVESLDSAYYECLENIFLKTYAPPLYKWWRWKNGGFICWIESVFKKNHPSSNSHEVMKPSYHQALFVGPFPTDDFFEVPTKHTPSSGFFSPTSSSKMSLAGSWHVVLFKWFLSNEPRKNPPTFHSTGWFIGIIIMICYNPYIPG